MSETTKPMEETEANRDSTEDIHELLASTRRQHVLAVLTERQEPVELLELAAEVADREMEHGPENRAVEEMKISLHHTHLPKLADVDVIDYCTGENLVVPKALPNSAFIPGV